MVKQISGDEAARIWTHAYATNSLHVPFLSYEWHRLWERTFGQQSNTFTLSIDDKLIAPFVRVGHQVKFSGGEEIADYLDIVGPSEFKQHAWIQIMEFLQKENIQEIHLRNIPETSPTFTYFSKQKNLIVQKEDTTPIVVLPSSWETYLSSLTRKYRHELERKIRKFEREHIDAEFHESKNPAEDIHTFLSLMEKDPVKKSFLTTEMKTFFTTMTETFSDQISLMLLSMGDKQAAATLAFVENEKYYLYNSGFDKTCCANGGFYLKAMSLKYAIERGYKEYNFLQGSERYKYELGGMDVGVYKVDNVFV
jgi:CelD/BcsL family acetyltransferase involved in cellulose biosynthesis